MRILIAEDDQVLADGLLRSLRASGAAVDHVSSGSEADAALMANNEFDLLILDLGSPAGVTRVDAAGRASRFATIASVDSLFGIAFDTTGRFGYALLVVWIFLAGRVLSRDVTALRSSAVA